MILKILIVITGNQLDVIFISYFFNFRQVFFQILIIHTTDKSF